MTMDRWTKQEEHILKPPIQYSLSSMRHTCCCHWAAWWPQGETLRPNAVISANLKLSAVVQSFPWSRRFRYASFIAQSQSSAGESNEPNVCDLHAELWLLMLEHTGVCGKSLKSSMQKGWLDSRDARSEERKDTKFRLRWGCLTSWGL